MLLKCLHGVVDLTLVLEQGFTRDEIGPYGVNQHAYEEAKGNMKGFSVNLKPIYDTDMEPRFKDKPELKRKMEKQLREHPGMGKLFEVWDVTKDPVTLTTGELAELKKKAAAYDELNAPSDKKKSA